MVYPDGSPVVSVTDGAGQAVPFTQIKKSTPEQINSLLSPTLKELKMLLSASEGHLEFLGKQKYNVEVSIANTQDDIKDLKHSIAQIETILSDLPDRNAERKEEPLSPMQISAQGGVDMTTHPGYAKDANLPR